MHIMIVSIKVKPECLEGFREVTLENARMSRKEPGIFRFELLEDRNDPAHFLLVEGYLDDEAPARHKETKHFLAWKEAAEPMLAEARTRSYYEPVGEPG
ncbi:MAG: putative quinol monooxygenase [Rectinemataceae bacterium]